MLDTFQVSVTCAHFYMCLYRGNTKGGLARWTKSDINYHQTLTAHAYRGSIVLESTPTTDIHVSTGL